MDNETQRGIKRKRYEPPQEELSVRIKGKLHHEMKEVHKATKRAKLFETQKVVKKLKDMAKKGDNTQAIDEYEAELTCLKGIDHDSIGNTALKTKLLKDRILRENEDILTTMNNELEGSLVAPAEPGTTVAKIQSRLLSSRILSMQVATSLDALKILLNPTLKKNEPENNIHARSDKSVERPSKVRKERSTSSLQATNLSIKAPSKPDDTDVDEADWESGSVAGSGVEEPDDGWESGDIGYTLQEDVSNREFESKNVEPKVEWKSKPSKLLVNPTKTSIVDSTFLPSLSVGFIRGGSDDSDWSETEGKGTDLEPKKNRRGQRARRAIWEKKFGRNAHHKRKEEEANAQVRKVDGHTSKIIGSNSNRLPGLSAVKGSTRYPKDKKFSPIQHPVDAGWSTRTVGASIPAAVAPAVTDRQLHPSWEAKRRLKEKQSISIVPSQGTKIKFS